MKQLVFKIPEFPHLSETFIVNQIAMAIDLGFDVKIIVSKIISYDHETLNTLIIDYKMFDKIIVEDFKIPLNFFLKIWKWILILIKNISSWIQIFKLYRLSSKPKIGLLFEMQTQYK